MGTVYGVDVGDGAGVRPSTASYDGNGGYEVASSSGGYAPQLTVTAIAALEAALGSSTPFTVNTVKSTTVANLTTVLVGDLVSLYAVDLTVVMCQPLTATSDGSVGLSVIPGTTRPERLVAQPLNGWLMPSWFAVNGQPEAVTGLVVEAEVTAGVGGVIPLETYPDPKSTFIPASLRWIADSGTMTPLATSWWPYSKSIPSGSGTTVWQLAQNSTQFVTQYTVGAIASTTTIILPNTRNFLTSYPGVNPTYVGAYSYWRAGDYVRIPALAFRDGDHMWIDTVNWNAQAVTVIAAVVLHRPSRGWYAIAETSAPSTTQLQPFFGIRYDSGGQLVLWADAALASLPIDTGQTRPNQPVIVGFNVDMDANTCSLLVVDTTVKVITSALPYRYDNRSRLWLGRSPHGDQATANMDLLEVGVFTETLSQDRLRGVLGLYDRMYGVSAS